MTIICEKGAHIRHWLYTEPVCLDVSPLYENNYRVPFETYRAYTDAFLAAVPALSPREGRTETLMGTPVRWRLLRMAEGDVKPTWAVFGTSASFLCNFAFCTVSVPEPGAYTCILNTVGAAAVFVNGCPCLEHRSFRRTGNQDLTFSADLQAGPNTLLIALWNAHLHASNSFALRFPETAVTVSLPLAPCEDRETLEADFAGLCLADTVVTDAPVLCSAAVPKSPGQFFWTVSEGGTVRLGPLPLDFTGPSGLSVPLPDTEVLPPGISFQLSVDYMAPGTADGMIQGPVFSFERLQCVPAPKLDAPQRIAHLKAQYADWADLPESRIKFRSLYACLAKLANGQPCPVPLLEQGLDYINARYDCADFGMHALIRILYQFPEGLTGSLYDRARACVLNFKYNEDDGGPSMMFCRSENHRILFAALEYLAGGLFPHERFTQSGEQGIFHQHRGRCAVEKWIREKGRYGFMEWHSNTYYEEDAIAMLNLYDFAAAYDDIRVRAGNMLDFIGVLMASHSAGGVMATTHGRCYEKNLFYPLTEPTAHLVWLLCGTADRLAQRISTGALCLMTSAYRPGALPEKLAASAVLETRSRMGLFFSRGMDGVPCYTYRCPEYMVSAALEHRPGACGAQVQTGQILLEHTLPIFCTSFENASEHTRPSYWGGQYRMPRAMAASHLLAYAYRLDTPEGATHCYFPLAMFDETRRIGRWIAGRKGRAYAAVFCSAGFTVTRRGAFRDRELLCPARDAVWIIQLGTEAEFGSFSAFCGAVDQSGIQEADGGVQFDSPACGTVSLSFDHAAQNGAPLQPKAFPLIENSFVYSQYGSGIHQFPDRILNFSD